MHNDIYARHGYIFKKGSKEDNYFKQQSWYIPKNKSVGNLLSETEKTNILKIRKMLNKSLLQYTKKDYRIIKVKK